jgi:TPR repeat protein
MHQLIGAAERGEASSQFNLGVVYANGLDDNNRPVPGRRKDAIKWLTRAARQGLPRAQCRLAELYETGGDTLNRDVLAYIWFALAAKNSAGANRYRAQSGCARLSLRLRPAQISAAARFIRRWAPTSRDASTTPELDRISPKKDI